MSVAIADEFISGNLVVTDGFDEADMSSSKSKRLTSGGGGIAWLVGGCLADPADGAEDSTDTGGGGIFTDFGLKGVGG
jgi:hypothetical protein